MGNILKDKSMAFAIRIVNLHKYPNKRKAYSLSPQKNITKPFSGLNCYLKQNIYPKQNIQACL